MPTTWCSTGPRYFRDGQELQDDDVVVLPGIDPVPHYNRGRAYVAPYSGADQAAAG